MWPITTMPESLMARIRLATRTPPSSFTASTSASLRKRPAFITACSSLA